MTKSSSSLPYEVLEQCQQPFFLRRTLRKCRTGSSGKKRNRQRTKHPEYLLIHTNSFQISTARHGLTNPLCVVSLPPRIWLLRLLRILAQGRSFKLKTTLSEDRNKSPQPHPGRRKVSLESAGHCALREGDSGGRSVPTASPLLGCS